MKSKSLLFLAALFLATNLFSQGLNWQQAISVPPANTIVDGPLLSVNPDGQFANNSWASSGVMVTNGFQEAQTLTLTSGQRLSANSSGSPVAANDVAGTNMSITTDGLGNNTFNSTAEAGEIDTPVTCQFNAGSASGVTDFTATLNFKQIGGMVFVEIPEMGVVIPGSTPAVLDTSLSASPACIPSGLRPPSRSSSPIFTNSDGIIPEGAPGNFQITDLGNIIVYMQVSGQNFPNGLWGGTGFHEAGTDNWTQQISYALAPGVPAYTITGSATGGGFTPPSQVWLPGDTTSVTFAMAPNVGYTYTSSTDDCNGGSPGGTPAAGNTQYIVTTATQSCTVSATFTALPVVSTSNIGFGSGTFSPSSAYYTGSPLSFAPARDPGSQLNTYGLTDNCNGGAQSGAWNVTHTVYVVPVVTGNCTVQGPYYNLANWGYFDFTATSSIAAIPNSAYLNYNSMLYGFGDPSITTLPTAYVNAIVNAVVQNRTAPVMATPAYAIGGATYGSAAFNAVGISTAVSNLLSQISQINTAIGVACGGCNRIQRVTLDLEDGGWTAANIDLMASLFQAANFQVWADPQVYTSGGNINSNSPTNLILTSGGGAPNNYGLAVSDGNINGVNAQVYNSSGFTCDGNDESTTDFSGCILKSLTTLVKPTCSGPTPLCLLGTNGMGGTGMTVNITQVANGGAGCYSIFNTSGCPLTIVPSYSQSTILSLLVSSLGTPFNTYPLGQGLTMWSINNDWGATLYPVPDTFATAGGFTAAMYVTPLFKKLSIAPHYPMDYKNPALRGVRYDVVPEPRKHHHWWGLWML